VAPRDPRILGAWALLEFDLGNFTQGANHLEGLLEAMRLTLAGPNYEYAYLAAVIPVVARITGDFERLGIAEQTAQAVLASPSASPYLAIQARLALAMLAVLRSDAAAAEQYEAIESVRGTQLGEGGMVCSDRMLGLLAQVVGRTDDAMVHFEDALRFCRRAGYRPEYAWSASEYADLLLERTGPGDRAKAISLLNEALQIARSLGMTPLMERLTRHGLHTERLTPDEDKSAVEAIASETTIERPTLRSHGAPDGTVTVMFIDIEDFGAMNEKLGDQGAEEVLSAYRAVVRQHVEEIGGSEVRSMRDGYMLAFPSATGALQCAIAIQRSFVDYNYAHPEEPVRVCMGLNVQEASDDSEDLLGDNFILAARLADQAQGGRILISALVKEIIESSSEFTFDEGREMELKGLPGTHRVYEVMWRREGDVAADSVRYFG
jgi:class 3 adenylate cyclase